MLETIKPNADFVVDGTLQVTEVAKIVFDNIKKLPLKHIQGKNLWNITLKVRDALLQEE